MYYKDLSKAIDWFKHDTFAYDSAYIRSRNITDWRNLHTFSDEEIKIKVLGFLNAWRCRIGITKEVVTQIKEAYSEVIPYLRALEGEALENTDFEQQILVSPSSPKVSDCINFSMDVMIGVGYRFRHVAAASKLLHMVNPALFVMWDNYIIMNYRLSRNANSYAYKFMPLMQQEANEAIETYMKDFSCDRDQAIKGIKTYGTGKTLAKLVDEFNYWKFSSGSRV